MHTTNQSLLKQYIKNIIMKKRSIFTLLLLSSICFLNSQKTIAQEKNMEDNYTWQSPDEDILKILHAPQLPRTSTSPTRTHMLLTDRVYYPPLSELAGPMLKLAGTRVNPKNNYYHGRHGGTSPRILTIKDGETIALNIPDEAEILSTNWTVDGQQFALSVGFEDRIELWMGNINGQVEKVPNMILNPLNDQAVRWFPDQEKLLIRRINDRGAVPQKPSIPKGPKILEDAGATARSTYESRNLLETAYDDELFSYYTQCELVIYDTKTKQTEVVGPADAYISASISPDGNYLLIEKMKKPWSHEVAWWMGFKRKFSEDCCQSAFGK